VPRVNEQLSLFNFAIWDTLVNEREGELKDSPSIDYSNGFSRIFRGRVISEWIFSIGSWLYQAECTHFCGKVQIQQKGIQFRKTVWVFLLNTGKKCQND
jgi:hypothetical protein